MNSLAHNRTVCFIALVATVIFSLGTCSGYLLAADVTEVVEEEVVVEEAPAGVEAEEITAAEPAPVEEPTGEGETPAGEEDGFWDGPWPWIIGGAVVVGGGVGIAAAASGGGGGGGGGDDGYNVVGSWNIIFDWDCDGTTGSTVVTLHEGGSATPTYGSGSWVLNGSSITMTFIASPVTVIYAGAVTSNTYMEGTMSNNYGETGCWYANKTTSGMRSISSGSSNLYQSDTTR